jgi:hypothetical protein
MYTDMAGHMQPVGAIMHAVDPLGKGTIALDGKIVH